MGCDVWKGVERVPLSGTLDRRLEMERCAFVCMCVCVCVRARALVHARACVCAHTHAHTPRGRQRHAHALEHAHTPRHTHTPTHRASQAEALARAMAATGSPVRDTSSTMTLPGQDDDVHVHEQGASEAPSERYSDVSRDSAVRVQGTSEAPSETYPDVSNQTAETIAGEVAGRGGKCERRRGAHRFGDDCDCD